ncbi:MAG: glycosyltransferase family 2 protein [Chloroflexi bacterium]|nr:glycosyltransferase family 2 protein [Chloroflexota bacterium]
MSELAGATSGAAPLLSVIIVNYNTRALLARALDAVAASTLTVPHEIIVVDNGSTDGSLALLRERFPAARVIANERNVGFAAANNQGLAAARGEAFILLNSDAAPEPAAIATLWAALQARPAVGVVGPCLLNPDGSVQSSRRRFPTLATLTVESTPLAQWRPFIIVGQRFEMSDVPAIAPQSVDWLVGACLLVRRAAVDAAGPLDAGFFLYAEELEWQWRIQHAGWGVWYEPAARVLHDGGRSSAPESQFRHQAHQASRVRLTRLLHGRIAGEAIRAWLLLLDAGQLTVEAAKWTLGHRPTLRRRRVALYCGLLRSRLAMPRPAAAERQRGAAVDHRPRGIDR